MERVGEESVFFVINGPLRDLTFCSLKFRTPFQKTAYLWPIYLEVLSGDRGLIPMGKGAARLW